MWVPEHWCCTFCCSAYRIGKCCDCSPHALSTFWVKNCVNNLFLISLSRRYHSILQKIATKDKSFSGNDSGIDGGAGTDDIQNIDVIIEHIRDVNAIQTVNAIFQYFPQLLFQSFLIYFVHYKCLLTGKSRMNMSRNWQSNDFMMISFSCRCIGRLSRILLFVAYFDSLLLFAETVQRRLQTEWPQFDANSHAHYWQSVHIIEFDNA